MPRAERPAMAEYGVPADAEGALAWSWAEVRLTASRNFWLATASAAGRPHAMPVWGVWLTDPDRFVFSCAPSSRKAANLRANPRAVVAADDTVECVSVEGRAREVSLRPDGPEAQAYAHKYEPAEAKRAELAAFMASHAAFELLPERAFGIIEREDEFASRATRWVW
ncbi:MAG: pyridoxamine 5'-phosphate oxidase family protein [Acidimicrobiales bacterium]